ncbi:MAG: leucine-rich repeat domain-containing protein [Ruminococcaceae bacterium]|nr:leucine-rich repeat domain-containing protein [Oscillospiraceae bacterium]
MKQNVKKFFSCFFILFAVLCLFTACDEKDDSTQGESVELPPSDFVIQTMGSGECAVVGLSPTATISDTMEIPSEYNGLLVTEIRRESETSWDGINKLIVPEGVTIIRDHTFADSTISEIVLPDSLLEIGHSAFSFCRNLKQITIPNGVTEIEEQTFAYCPYLERIKLPDGITKISTSAFLECVRLLEINIPSSVTDIETHAFLNCMSLEEITLPSNIKEIKKYTFDNCRSLKSIAIPEGVTRIGEAAFRSCKDLKDVSISESVTEIGPYAFQYSGTGLEIFEKEHKLIIPKGVTKIGVEAFQDTGFTDITILGNIENWSFGSESLSEGELLSMHGAFADNSMLKSVTVSGNCKRIGDYAFQNCGNLTKITLEEGVTIIGNRAFFAGGDWKISDLILPPTLTIPKSVTEIGNEAFVGTSFNKVIILGNVTDWGESAFGGCMELEIVEISGACKTIGRSAFAGGDLKKVTLGEGVTHIENFAFGHCYGLEVILPESIEWIDSHAFSGASKVYLPAGFVSSNFADDAFQEPTVIYYKGSEWELKGLMGGSDLQFCTCYYYSDMTKKYVLYEDD